MHCPAQQPAGRDSLILNLDDITADTTRIKTLDDLAWEVINSDPAKAAVYAAQALDLARKGSHIKLEATLLNTLGVAHGNSGEFQKALEHYNAALTIRRSIRDEAGIASSLVNMSNIYFNQGLYDKALTCNLEGLKAYEKLGNKRNAATVTINIGNIHQNNSDYDLAKKYYDTALVTSREANYILGESDAYIGLGNVFNHLEQYDHALYNYKRSLVLKVATEDKIGMSRCYNNMGNAYKNLGKYDSALFYYRKDLGLSGELNNPHLLIYPYKNIGDILLLKTNLNEAQSYYAKALELSSELQARDLSKDIYQQLSELYLAKKDYKKAYEFQHKYQVLKDSLFNEVKSQQIAELQTRYEAEQKENEIKILHKSSQLQKAEISRATLLRDFFIVGFILILIITLLFYRSIRQRKAANRLLLEQKAALQELNAVKDKLFSVISHDLRNPLTSIHGFLQLMGRKKDPAAIAPFIANADAMVNNTINLLDNLLFWSASQVKGITPQFSPVNVYEIVEEVKELFGLTIQAKEISVDNLVAQNRMVYADESCVKVIVRNLISNAVKFSHTGGKINVRDNSKGEMTEISVADNGVGLREQDMRNLFTIGRSSTKGTNNEKGVGLGLFLCKEFVSKNEGEISVASEWGHGTVFSFTLKSYVPSGSSLNRLTKREPITEE